MNTKIDNKKDYIKEMFEAGVHFGYAKSRRHPSVSKYILGRKNNVEIFDLEKVQEKLQVALEFVAKLAKENKQILFVGGKVESRSIIKEVAEKIEAPYVSGRWIGGTLTNFDEIKKRVNKFVDLSNQRDKGLLGKYTKKERLLIERQIKKLEETFGGIVNLNSKPGAVFIIDSNKEKIAREEAIKMNVPIIALCSSDCDISMIKYPIPANDSLIKSISYFTNLIAETYKSNRTK
ncbi:MAG TPA: 30S ribosomal protein S2 [Candidatus Paceibacterota bacterium]|nr:30S ribosomal protein S2 [Candidatus Paceibacterota bacterium]HMP19069.1 30S ribosomal protein S2 [Candidatus Paceibacterota bacterium]HMP85419.1 30S ribosomal protein S2 [Candidatus Paceibacterota bacterium]